MKMEAYIGLALALAALACGCQTASVHRSGEASGALSVRNNVYSLLYRLLSDERHVSKLLIIKRDRRELNRLINQISDASAQGADRLKQFAAKDPSLNLAVEELPPGEQATRHAIAVTKRNQLLGSSGEEFERSLLLTQMEALNYAVHLTEVAAKNDWDPMRSLYLSDLSKTLKHLHSEVFKLLFSQPRLAGDPFSKQQG